MVALFVVFFIAILLLADYIVNRSKARDVLGLSAKEKLVAESSPSELGLTMADGGELIDKE